MAFTMDITYLIIHVEFVKENEFNSHKIHPWRGKTSFKGN